MPATGELGPRRFRLAIVAILLAAAAWRVTMAALLPVISRDGVTFCWYARDLGQQGLDYLRDDAAQQHPLYPVLILGVQRTARLFGAADSPSSWQHSAQFVALLGGVAVVGLAGALAHRLIRRLALPVSPRLTVLLAMVLAALLDFNVWLSADAMSDQVHLAFYLAAVWLMLELTTLPRAAACGLLAGLAFLTREEGIVPLLGGLAVLWAQWRAAPAGAGRRAVVARAGVLCAAFLLLVGPYWTLVGRFSTKKDVADLVGGAAQLSPASDADLCARAASSHATLACAARSDSERSDSVRSDSETGFTYAKLQTHEYPWYALVPQALYQVVRGGRVIVPLLAVLPLLNLRRRLLGPELAGYTTCLAGHFALMLILLERAGYLHARHTLVVVNLLVPPAALFLGRLYTLALERRSRGGAAVVLAVAFVPLALYAPRVPNSADAFLRRAADWMRRQEPDAAGRRLVAGASPMRVAFLADLEWVPWWERPEDEADYQDLKDKLGRPAPGYFALELEAPDPALDQFEIRGNRALLERLQAEPDLAPRLQLLHVEPAPRGRELHLFRIAGLPPGSAPP